MNQTMTKQTHNAGEILKTTDYSVFKGVIGNRGIHEPHLRRLRSSMERRNMLPANPIIVNERMEVADGQHRLTAAKELGLPIYYTIVENAGLEEIQMLNANNRAWTTYDYLESYIAMGKKEYITLKQFADEYRISIPIAMKLLTNFKHNQELLRDYRDGKFEVEDYDRADQMASLLTEIRKYSPDMAWAQINCVRAVAITQEALDDPKLLVDQLKRYNQVVTRRMSVKDYLAQFENILNANRPGAAIKLREEEEN